MEEIADLVIRAASAPAHGERIDAYGRLVERFLDMACGYAYSIVGDFHLAEDVAQEAFIAAFGKLGQLQSPEAFPGWFRRIVWSQCGRATRRKVVPATGLEAAAEVVSAAPSPDEAAERTEMRDQVLAAIRGLSDPEREVTTLFYINGYSQKDIADFLEVSVGTVNNRLNASRSRLKKRMIQMVDDTLKKHAPGEGLRKRVMAELVRQRTSFNEGLGGFPVLEVGNVRLREIRPEEDAKHWLAVRSTEGREAGWPDATLMELTKEFEGVRSRFYTDKYVIYWAIAGKDDDHMIGNIRYWEYMGHWSCPWAFGTIQYELAAKYWHKGIGPAALRAAAEFGLTHLDFARVQCSIAVDDTLRESELIEAGFTKEGRLRCWWYDAAAKQWEDELMFSLTKSDLAK